MRTLDGRAAAMAAALFAGACATAGSPDAPLRAQFDWFEYAGSDPVYEEHPAAPDEHHNPILSGFYPDPSITRAGEDFYLVTSTFTLGELLVKPVEMRRDDLRDAYERGLKGAAELVPFNVEAARAYAQIRGDRTIRPPDAVQLACAASASIDLFITNDDRLSRRTIPGIQFLTSLQQAPL